MGNDKNKGKARKRQRWCEEIGMRIAPKATKALIKSRERIEGKGKKKK